MLEKDLVFSIFYGTPELLIGQIEQQGQKAQDQNPNRSGTFPVVEFWLSGPHQEGRDIFREMLKIVHVAIFEFNKLVFQWWTHGNPTTWVSGVFI